MKRIFIINLVIIVFLSACQKDDNALPKLDYVLNKNIYLPRENGDSAFIADPHVIKVGSKWYLYGTGFSATALAAWSSENLIDWKLEGKVWEPIPGAWNSINLWAPEVIQGDDGKFYMYYSANGRIGVAAADAPTGPFLDVYDHPLIGGGYGGVGDGIFLTEYDASDPSNLIDFEEYAIDAAVFRASDGQLYIYFAALTPLAVIAVLPMDDYVTVKNVIPAIALKPQLFSWENVTREGAWVIERNGVFHLMYSGALWYTNNYGIGVATASSPMGPFTRRADNPILRKSAQFNLAGPGHHSVVEGKYNDLLIFYHTRNWGDQPSAVRKTRYMQMYFDRNGQIQINKVVPER